MAEHRTHRGPPLCPSALNPGAVFSSLCTFVAANFPNSRPEGGERFKLQDNTFYGARGTLQGKGGAGHTLQQQDNLPRTSMSFSAFPMVPLSPPALSTTQAGYSNHVSVQLRPVTCASACSTKDTFFLTGSSRKMHT